MREIKDDQGRTLMMHGWSGTMNAQALSISKPSTSLPYYSTTDVVLVNAMYIRPLGKVHCIKCFSIKMILEGKFASVYKTAGVDQDDALKEHFTKHRKSGCMMLELDEIPDPYSFGDWMWRIKRRLKK